MSGEPHRIDRRRLGAISILLGNAGLFANGLIAYRYGDTGDMRAAGVGRMTSAALFSGTGVIIGRYGSSPVEAQLGRLEKKLAAFMKQHDVPLDAEQIKNADAEIRKGWFSKLEDFAYDHPMECSNIYNSVAALGMLGSGILRRRGGETSSGNANILNCLMVLAGTLTCVLVQERTPEQIAKQGDAGTLWGSMQKQPLNYAVWPFLGADLSYGMQAYGEHQTAKQLPQDSRLRPWTFIMSAISAFVMATSTAGDLLTGFSSKKPGGTPKDRKMAQDELIDMASRILASQPPDMQKELAQQAAQYLSKQQGLRMVDFDPADLTARILKALPENKDNRTSTDIGRS